MGRITLVRHGQASFMTDDYDRLSALGEEQSRALGRYLAEHQIPFTRAYTGPCLRHRQTGEHAHAAAAEAAHPMPSLQDAPGLGEFDWEQLLAHALTGACDEHPLIQQQRRALEAAESLQDKRRAIHFLMEAVTAQWVEGRLDAPGAVPFQEFQARVHADLERIMAETGKGGHAIVYTSGGPAGVSAGMALGLPPAKILELMWTLRNAALVELIYTGGRVSLAAFNNAPHLPSPSLWTHR